MKKILFLVSMLGVSAAGLVADAPDLSKIKAAQNEAAMMEALKEVWQPFIKSVHGKTYDEIYQLIIGENPPEAYAQVLDAIREYADSMAEKEPERRDMLYGSVIQSLFELMPDPVLSAKKDLPDDE